MTHRTSSRLSRVTLSAMALAGSLLFAASPAWADRLILQDGRELEGTLVPLESIAGNKAPPADGVVANNILMCDTGLKRIFVSQRNIREIIPGAAGSPNEVFRLKQRSGVARGQVNDVQAIMQITPFDEHGRRTFTINTPNGPTDIFQGITEINPIYTRVAGINYQWDLRISTNSIPNATIETILKKNIPNPESEENRRKYAMFLIQCQRYGEAKAALDQMTKDFPNLKDRIEPVSRQLVQARARQILKELEVRKGAGQFRLGRSILEQFPVYGVSGEILQTVRTMNEEVRNEDDLATKAWKDFDSLLAKCNDDDRKRIMTVRNEIFARRSELVPSDVRDWIAFCSLLAQEWQEAANAPKDQPVQTPAVRLGAMLPVEAREIVQTVAKNGAGTEADGWRLTRALNAVLLAPNFYQEEEFGNVALPEEAKLLLARNEKLRSDDQMRLNRLLLEAAYPQLIMVSEFSGLTPTTMQRLSSFIQLSGDPKLEPAEKLSLAVSGWLMGSNAAQQNLAISLSLWDARRIVRDYLNESNGPNREKLIADLRALEGTTPENVVKLLENMAPPIPTQPQEHPGFYELTLPPAAGELPVTYFVQLPHEYDPHRRYPAIVTLHGARSVAGRSVRAASAQTAQDAENPNRTDGKPDGKAAPPDVRASQIDFWAGSPDEYGQRQGQAMRNGYIVIAPAWGAQGQPEYEYSGREHTAVLASLRDACRRFAIDTDRVFLSGHDIGGDATYDIGFAHPDLWAGIIPIVGKSDRYCSKTWPNALRLPIYSLGGELDPTRVLANAREHDRLFLRNGTDLTVIEYLGRGHEYFGEDLLDIFDWMKRKKRDFFPKKVEGVSLRPWDNFFFWIETANHPAKTICLPTAWPTDGARTNAMAVEAEIKGDSRILVKSGAGSTTILLSPEMGLDFTKNIEVQIGAKRLTRVGTPDLTVILEDARTRGDRQHVFWSKVTSHSKAGGAAELQQPRARPAKRP